MDKYVFMYRGDTWFMELTKDQFDMLEWLRKDDILPDDFDYTNITNVPVIPVVQKD